MISISSFISSVMGRHWNVGKAGTFWLLCGEHTVPGTGGAGGEGHGSGGSCSSLGKGGLVGAGCSGVEGFWSQKLVVNGGSVQWKMEQVFEGGIQNLVWNMLHLRCLLRIKGDSE